MKKDDEPIGTRFGRLTVTGYTKSGKNGNETYCECLCDCGNRVVIQRTSLRNGHTKSCGCIQREKASNSIKMYNNSDSYKGVPSRRTHGMSETRLYSEWLSMRNRCYNKKNKTYRFYGGAGIDVCDEWNNSAESFINWSLQNGYSDSLTIDRIDVKKGYYPDNCRWITAKEQSRNKRNTLWIEHDGETKSFVEWCEIFGIRYEHAYLRKQRGMSFEEIFSKKDFRKEKRKHDAIH